ncbi:transcriptional repressor [Desulfovibrio desulfuricans]|uniref:Transcriptional repressor n=2 Tax=Desulfovibrio desulfuricans TaxID=876 RepID=A0A4P7UKL4_DESDE|nr:transcriptional repressor [Desulfovibrio desulfuricans]
MRATASRPTRSNPMQQKKPTDSVARPCAADALCASRGLRLTRLRRQVLSYLLETRQPVKAYDILDALRNNSPKALTPASVYRSLEFLLQAGLVHRVETLNAFVACAETCNKPHDPVFMLVCPGCRKSREINDPDLYQTIFSTMQQRGFQLQGDTVELTGLCPGCAATSAGQQQQT